MHVIDRLEAIQGKGRACAITQQDQSSQARRSSRLTVLVDAVEADRIVACSYADAPEIDGQVLIPGAWEIEPGDFIKVTVTGSDDYDLRAEPVEDWRRLPRSRAVHPAKAGRVV